MSSQQQQQESNDSQEVELNHEDELTVEQNSSGQEDPQQIDSQTASSLEEVVPQSDDDVDTSKVDEIEEEEIIDDDVSFETKGPTPRNVFASVGLGVLLCLIISGVILRLVLSAKHPSANKGSGELTRKEEAMVCADRGCLNLNCITIDACYTDPDSAYCADYGCVHSDCPLSGACAIDGRPFRENLLSQPLVAETTTTCDDCRWSSFTKNKHRQTLDMHVVSTWSERAVGEHASIASFAAFVIALLTHEAPPDLIADALKAAADELRHAQLAFGRAAAANGGKGLGPTALPSSRLDFNYDLTTLAKAVAQEGCIDETLSALGLAQESEHENGDGDLLWDIARDEAQHSLLAWRTLQWVCQQDEAACQETMDTVLHPDRITAAAEARFGRRPQHSSRVLDDAWQLIAEHMIPSVRYRPVECPTYVPGASAVDTLAMDIIRGFCRPVMAA